MRIITETIYWIGFFLGPFLLSGLVSLILWSSFDVNNVAIMVVLVIGMLTGVLLAERIRKKYGCSEYWSRIYATPDILPIGSKKMFLESIIKSAPVNSTFGIQGIHDDVLKETFSQYLISQDLCNLSEFTVDYSIKIDDKKRISLLELVDQSYLEVDIINCCLCDSNKNVILVSYNNFKITELKPNFFSKDILNRLKTDGFNLIFSG